MDGGDEGRRDSVVLVVIVVLAALAVSSLLVAFSYYCYIRSKVARHRKSLKRNAAEEEPVGSEAGDSVRVGGSGKGGGVGEVQAVVSERGVQVFTFKQLHSSTGAFGKGNVVGHGSFGSVYRGVLSDGRKIAVKLMDRSGKQGVEEFKMEVDLLTRLRSPYLLGLLGYCSDSDHRLLVYEYMANGGLQEHLYPNGGSYGGVSKLDWETRMRIALEAAKGLEYLHEHVTPPVIHRDFKSSNILLDKNFHAKVSDFGLAKLGSDKVGGHVSTRVLGTQGYVAPEYALTGHLTTKSDVYSYGVVLLELLTGRVPVDMKRPAGEGVLVSWALPHLTDREKVVQIIDPAMVGQYSMKDVVQVAAIAAMCVQPEPDYRPLMADVVQSLVPLVKHKPTAKAGGPSWTVLLGRRDARTASQSAANSNIPSPASSLATLTSSFAAQGLSQRDLVALSGAHTIGFARCANFRNRIYNDANIDRAFANSTARTCPRTGGGNNLSPIDVQTPTTFDNAYYRNLVAQRGLLHSDQQLFPVNNGTAPGPTNAIVQNYISSNAQFFSDFVAAMVRMGNISPLTGTSGEIRRVCSRVN